MRWLLNEQYRRVRKLEEENQTLNNENARLVQNLAEYKNEITDLKEENKKLKKEYIRLLKNKIEANELKGKIMKKAFLWIEQENF